MRIAVCDLDEDYLRRLERLLRQIRALDAATIMFYSDPDWLAADVTQHEDAFDILVINCWLGNYSGVRLAKRILDVDPWCKLVLLCDNNTISPEFYTVPHSFVLSKSQVDQYLPRAMEKVASEAIAEDPDIITVTSSYTRLLLPGKEIVYIERAKRKSQIVLQREAVETVLTPPQILGGRIGKTYMQCHRSFYINLWKIRGLHPDYFVMTNSVRIPIGRSFHRQAKEAFEFISSSSLSVALL